MASLRIGTQHNLRLKPQGCPMKAKGRLQDLTMDTINNKQETKTQDRPEDRPRVKPWGERGA